MIKIRDLAQQKKRLNELIRSAERLVFFGGAGVSTESGIPDFRSPTGLYRSDKKYDYPAEVYLSIDFFLEQPGEFYRFYRSMIIYESAQPNQAHRRLAGLQEKGLSVTVITQNIDGLHQLAGSENVLELHGSVHRNYCLECGKNYSLSDVSRGEQVPLCACGGLIRPDVVLYGEPLDPTVMALAVNRLKQADLLIIGGTSLTVFPAAGLIDVFGGDNLVIINQSPTPFDDRASLIIREPIGQVLAD